MLPFLAPVPAWFHPPASSVFPKRNSPFLAACVRSVPCVAPKTLASGLCDQRGSLPGMIVSDQGDPVRPHHLTNIRSMKILPIAVVRLHINLGKKSIRTISFLRCCMKPCHLQADSEPCPQIKTTKSEIRASDNICFC